MSAATAESVTFLADVKVRMRLVEEGDLYARGHRYMTARSVVVPRVRSPTPDAAGHSLQTTT